MPEPEAPSRRAPIDLLDPTWLFLIAGLAILGAAVLVPALDDLAEAEFQRDRALAVERQRLRRLERYAEYRDALRREDPTLYVSLAASQLNQIPEGRTLILEPPDPASASASIFADLEPPPLRLAERRRAGSLLERWTTDDRRQSWLLGAGGVLLLVGLLPRTRAAGPGGQGPSVPA